MTKQYIRLAIVGGRDFQDYDYMKRCLSALQEDYTVLEVVSGGARGADSLGERWADEQGIRKKIFPADWNRYGKSAGFRRNRDIVANADLVAAFWDGRSRGTANTIELARMAMKTVKTFKFGWSMFYLTVEQPLYKVRLCGLAPARYGGLRWEEMLQ